MAELKTDTDKVNFYNQKIEELKTKSEEVKDLSEAALDFAMRHSREDVFGWPGMVNFFKTPDIDGKGIEKIAEQTIKGTGKYIEHLKTDSPPSLDYWNLDDTKYFKDSAANKRLETITKTDYNSIKSSLGDKKDGGEAESTGNKEIDKLSASELEALLSTTLVDYLKEIKIDRSANSSQDNYYTDNGNQLFKQLESTAPAAPPDSKKEEPAKTTETKTEVAQQTNPANPSPSPEIKPLSTAAEVKENVVEKSQQSVVNNSSNTITTTVSNTQNLPTTTNQTTPTTVKNIIETPVKQEPASQTASENTQKPEQNVVPSVLGSQQVTSGLTNVASASEAVNAPGEITSLLAGAFGMSGSDLLKSIGGDNMTTSLTNTAQGAMEAGTSTVSNIVSQATTTPKSILENAGQPKSLMGGAINTASTGIAKTVSEIPKIAEKIEPSPIQNIAEKKEETSLPSEVKTQESPMGEATVEGESSSPMSEKKAEEKGEKNNEEEAGNGELLKIMKEILKTLQGPLLTTETTPRFH